MGVATNEDQARIKGEVSVREIQSRDASGEGNGIAQTLRTRELPTAAGALAYASVPGDSGGSKDSPCVKASRSTTFQHAPVYVSSWGSHESVKTAMPCVMWHTG